MMKKALIVLILLFVPITGHTALSVSTIETISGELSVSTGEITRISDEYISLDNGQLISFVDTKASDWGLQIGDKVSVEGFLVDGVLYTVKLNYGPAMDWEVDFFYDYVKFTVETIIHDRKTKDYW